jgi:ketol-acid reductoisomerase
MEQDTRGTLPGGEEISYDGDVDLGQIRGRRIGIIGYGNQGRAHALNLRDSGCDVRVGLYEGSASWPRAESDSFHVDTTDVIGQWGDLLAILLPDQLHHRVFESSIAAHLSPGKTLLFAHGFSLQYGLVAPPRNVDVVLVAPVGPGHMLRRLFEEGSGVPAVYAVHMDYSGTSETTALAYAKALGCTRVGAVRTTTEEETETDLFGEQAVLCGGLSYLIKSGYDTLVQAGYQPALAYFECIHQVKLIADLIYEDGIAGMHRRISDTAEFGDYVAGPRVIDTHVRESMEGVLRDVQDGTFARNWIAESEAGMPLVHERRAEEESSPMEEVGRQLRQMMKKTGR